MSELSKRFSKPWRLAVLAHFLVSAAGFWTTALAAQGVADSSLPVPPWLEALHALAAGVLLQPLAYWVLERLALPWWTWAGLVATTALLALNSGLAVGFCLAVASLVRRG